MKGKRLAVLFLVCLLALCCCGCKSAEEKSAAQARANWNQADNQEKMDVYTALIKEYMLLTEDLGKNTPYPAMKRSVKGSMITSGLTQEEAISLAEEYLIREEAVFWQAKEDGIVPTDEEVKVYVRENVIEEVAQEENYDLVSEACEKEGITFEDTIWAYENSYKVDLIGEKAGITNYEDMADYQDEAVKAYKNSDAYKAYEDVLHHCAQLVRDNVTDKETLKAAEIYYE